MNKTPKMSRDEFLAHTKITPAGNRVLTPEVQPSGNLYSGPRPTWWIGIDPGLHTGFALWQARQRQAPGRFLEVTSLTFVATVRRLEKLVREFGPAALRVKIEKPQGNKPTFDKDVAATEANMKKREKMSQNVGSNKRDAQLLIDFLEDLGIPYDAIVPTGNGKKGKVEASFFAGTLGFPTRTNQHGRDAAALVLGL